MMTMLNEYQCKVCGAAYGLASLLNAHISMAHGIPTDVFDARPDSMKIADLERRVAALEAEIETLKAGK